MIYASRIHAPELITLAKELGLFPDTARNIQKVASRPFSSDTDLARAIQLDPIATARMLKLMNSGFYNLNRPLVDLRQAITLMGFRSARDLAIALVLGQRMSQLTDTTRKVWTHSVRSGCALHVLSRYNRVIPTTDAFVFGLLHDIGLLSMCVLEPDFGKVYDSLGGEYGPRLANAERLYFGLSHGELGAALLNSWGLPASIADAVANHHADINHNASAAMLGAAEFLTQDRTPNLDEMVANETVIATKLTERQLSIARGVYLEEIHRLAKSFI